jgi:hypothetical protein
MIKNKIIDSKKQAAKTGGTAAGSTRHEQNNVTKHQGKGRLLKVWQVTDFGELFELSDDIRKKRSGPLTFTKSVVTVSGLSKETEVKHFERMRDLKSRPNRHLLRSVFEDLKNWTGGKHYGQRGYLITTDCKPASYIYLAAQLAVDSKDLQKAMLELEQIGLLERVNLNGQFKDSGLVRTEPDIAGRKRMPLKKDKNNRKENRIEKVNEKQNNKNKIELEFEKERKKQKEALFQSSASQSEGEIKTPNKPKTDLQNPVLRGKETSTESKTIPTIPTKTDEPGQTLKEQSSEPARTPDNTIKFVNHKYTQDSLEFAYDIMVRLGIVSMDKLREDMFDLTPEQAAERGNWAAAWTDAASEFDSESMAKLKQGLLKRISIALKCGDDPPAYLRTAWKNLCRDVRKKSNKTMVSRN